MLDNGYESFGHALFRSVKLTHILHFPEDFFTMTTLASHVVYGTSLTWWRPGGLLPTVYAYSFYVCKIQNSQVCITDCVGLWAKVAYLYFVYNLCALYIFYKCK